MVLLSIALAQSPTLGTLPDPDTADILYVEALADCPFSRTWVDALTHVPEPAATVVVVTKDPLERWQDLVAERGWSDLVVVSDPDGARAAQLFRDDGRLGTTTIWRDGTRGFSWTPIREDDLPWRESVAFLTDPDRALTAPPRYSDIEMVMFAEDGLKQARKVGKYLRRKNQHPAANLEVALVLQDLAAKDKDRSLAKELLAMAREDAQDDETISAALEETAPAVETLTPSQLQAAIRRLDALIRAYYSGIVAADERAGGWQEHIDRALAEAERQPEWAWQEAAHWLVDHVLAPIDDAHFHVHGPDPAGGPDLNRWAAADGIVWFTDVVLDSSGTVRRGPDELTGAQVEVPPVPEPRDASFGVLYRFRSIDEQGEPQWLVGLFAADEPRDVRLQDLELPVHRARSALSEDGGEDWSSTKVNALPVLAVRTMRPAALEGLASTASGLRERDRLLLDLRRNQGGSDQPAVDWFARFHGGPFGGPTLAYKRRVGWFPRPASGTWTSDTPPYDGQLIVLTDKDTCSSGETFTMLAAQVPGSLRVGENSAGCLTQGNVRDVGTLPYLGLKVRFGTSTFHSDPVPGREAWGYFPDLWLDTPDPVSWLAELPTDALRNAVTRPDTP